MQQLQGPDDLRPISSSSANRLLTCGHFPSPETRAASAMMPTAMTMCSNTTLMGMMSLLPVSVAAAMPLGGLAVPDELHWGESVPADASSHLTKYQHATSEPVQRAP
jgi:hypothetical protein